MFKLGLIGYPLGHSFSGKYFNGKFKEEKINGAYNLYPLVSIDELPLLIKNNPDMIGFNVTAPYKESVIQYMDELDQHASNIGAVNVVSISSRKSGNTVLKGYNTDWIGFRKSLAGFMNHAPKKALIIGTGGAARGVIYALHTLGIECTVVSRSASRNKMKIGDYHCQIISYANLNEQLIKSHKLIVNATPLGMNPHLDKAPDIPYEFITEEHWCYDLIYNPEITLFMRLCMEKGPNVKNGLDMLHQQAEAAWEIWEHRITYL